MGVDHDALRERLGQVGVWTFAFDEMPVAAVAETAREVERLGFSALWVPEGRGSRDVLTHLAWLACSTADLTVCSGIANVMARQADVLRDGAITLTDAFGDRIVVGIGIGHQVAARRRGVGWDRPVERMARYLDGMDEPSSLPAPRTPVRRMLAALGDSMLRLSAERSLGAHSYFVPVAHTARARSTLGPEPVLAVELTAVVGRPRTESAAIARSWAAGYLDLPNYANNWRRLGFSEDDVEGPSDRLLDAAIPRGSAEVVAGRVREHLDAGADHVCVQLIAEDGSDACLSELRELAAILLPPGSGSPDAQ
jgi:probable F420-dependent oxidoreductase